MRAPIPSSRDRLRSLSWPVAAMALMLLVFWRPAVLIASTDAQLSADDGATMSQASGPPWHYGSTLARYTLILSADLDCPSCKAYLPALAALLARPPKLPPQSPH